jgi:predicted DNA-binding transcriptional regulator AlpA
MVVSGFTNPATRKIKNGQLRGLRFNRSPPMTVLLRFRDLKSRGIVNSWPQLRRLIDLHDFPRGRLLSPNTRAWTGAEIDDWIASRPVGGGQLRGAAKARHARRKAAQSEAGAS